MSRTLITFICFLCSLYVSALEIDSVRYKQIVREGQAELCNLLEYNSHTTRPEEMKFTVFIDGNEPTYSRIVKQRVDTLNANILSQTCIDSLDAILSRTYRDYHIEMYVIVIKTFNIIIESPITQPVTINNLFNTHLYDESTNIACIRNWHTTISNEIIQTTFSARNRDCIVYSRGSYSGSLIPTKTGTWHFSKRFYHTASNRTYPRLEDLGTCFYNRIANNPEVINSGYEYSLQAVAREFDASARYMALKDSIFTTYTSPGISTILAQFVWPTDYDNLTEPERIHCLAVFAGYAMFDDPLVSQEESYACKIIESTPSNQATALLVDLELNSPLNVNPNYQGDKDNEVLIYSLLERIDDAVLGQKDNYARFIRGLTALSLSNPGFVESRLPSTDEEWIQRQIFWDDQYTVLLPPIGTHNYTIDFNQDGSIKIKKQVCYRHDERPIGDDSPSPYIPQWDDSYPEDVVSPFDLVVITNRSSLSMMQAAGMMQNQPYLAPAIALEYCDDKEFNNQAITTTAIVLSTIGAITGPAAIVGAIEAGNVALALFEGLQFVGATSDLVANASLSTEFNECVQTFNQIVGIWGLTRVAVSAAKYSVDYLAGVKSGTMKPVPMATAELYCARYADVTDWSNVDPAVKMKMKRLQELLEDQVAAGNIVATTQFNRQIIDALIGFDSEISGLATSYNLTLEEFIALEAKSAAELTPAELGVVNSIRNSIAPPNSTTIMQKVIPKAHIELYLNGNYTQVGGFVSTCAGTKHLTTYEDLYYGLRLDYQNSDGSYSFLLNHGSCGVIRYKASGIENAYIPRSSINHGVDNAAMPYTGHGFTSGTNGRLGAPEWKSPYLTPQEGAELWEVYSNGTEILRGRFSASVNKFVNVQ